MINTDVVVEERGFKMNWLSGVYGLNLNAINLLTFIRIHGIIIAGVLLSGIDFSCSLIVE